MIDKKLKEKYGKKIDEKKLMYYIDRLHPEGYPRSEPLYKEDLTSEEFEEIEKELKKNNPEYEEIAKKLLSTKVTLLNVGDAIKDMPLSDSLKEKLKKIKQLERKKSFSFAKLLKHTYTKIIAGIAVLGVVIFALFKSAKGWTIGMMLKYWPIFIESILNFFRKSIEFIEDLIPFGKQVAEIFNDLMPLLT